VVGGLWLAGLFGGLEGNTIALAISEGWALYNLCIILGGIRSVLQHLTRRNTYRFPLQVPVIVEVDGHWLGGMTANIHKEGLALLLSKPLAEGTTVRVLMYLPQKIATGTLFIKSNYRNDDASDGYPWYCGGPFTPDTSFASLSIDEFLISMMERQMQPLPKLSARIS
jgi:hypothetical protein